MAEEREERRKGVEMESEEKEEGLKAWEQHAGVINMPRFDYTAPCALLHQSHSGFLITCSISAFPLPLFCCIVLHACL